MNTNPILNSKDTNLLTDNIPEVRISDIKIGKRHRKDMGDIEGLAQSIEETGLLQPIGITPDNKLVFGERRLRAYRDVMERETIPARIVDVQSVLHGQFSENMMRKGYTVSERVAIVEAVRSYKHGGDRRSKQVRNSDVETLTVDQLAKRVGLGGKDRYADAKMVVGKGVPELVEAMDKGEMAVSAAAELAKEPKDKQRECMKRKFDGDKLTARAIRKQLRRIENRKKRDEALTRAVQTVGKHDSIQIHHCPFQELEGIAGIEPESVQLICTDIPYGNEFVDQIGELAAFSDRVLVSGGLFVAYLGQHRFNEKLRALDEHLKFQWLPSSVWIGVGNPVQHLNLVSKSIPLVVYSKGPWKPRTRWADTYVSHDREKDWHPWQRPLHEVEKLVQYFSNPGDLVVDPCGGGFTTAIACLRNHRRFVGCDVDKAAVVKGQERLDEERNGPAILPMKQIKINSVTEGDCRELIPALPDRSINLCVTSPPYADQRKGMYPGIPESEYPEFTDDWMSKLWDKLTDDGSVLIVIDPAVKDGVVADYVLRTQLALRDQGWKQHRTQIWSKKSGPFGHKNWPRHSYEEILWFRKTYEPILWFSKTAKPYCNAVACGEPSNRVGSPSYRYSDWSNGQNPDQDGIARVPDVWEISVGNNEKGVDHPAKFPVALPKALIQTFCAPGGTVLDNFAGSGSTLIAAKQLGCSYYGFDVMPEYVKLAQERLADVDPPALPEAG